MPSKVYIAYPSLEYQLMFKNMGWVCVPSVEDADLVQFTGGADVSPVLYKQTRHAMTRTDEKRDIKDMAVFKLAKEHGIPMAGICRGGQFLNVMCGGSMWQDVNYHTLSKGHEMFDHWYGEVLRVTSTHHQMMIPTKEAVILGTALETNRKEKHGPNDSTKILALCKPVALTPVEMQDIEVVLYLKDNCLCFQPHPEFPGEDDLALKYFEYLELLLSPGRLIDKEEDKICAG